MIKDPRIIYPQGASHILSYISAVNILPYRIAINHIICQECRPDPSVFTTSLCFDRVGNRRLERWVRAMGISNVTKKTTVSIYFFFSQSVDIFNKLLCPCDPWQHLRFCKPDEIDIVTFLTSLKKIIIDSCQTFWDLIRFHIMPIEKATHAGMLG